MSKRKKISALRLGNNVVTLDFNQISMEMGNICFYGLVTCPGFDTGVFSSLKTTFNSAIYVHLKSPMSNY